MHFAPKSLCIRELWVYPVRGAKGVQVQTAALLLGAGFAMDGTWCVVDSQAPERPVSSMATLAITPSLMTADDGTVQLELTVAGMKRLRLQHDFEEGPLEPLLLTERGDQGIADTCRRHPEGSQWISEYLSRVACDAGASESVDGKPRFALVRLYRLASPLRHPMLRTTLQRERGASCSDSADESSADDASASSRLAALCSMGVEPEQRVQYRHSNLHLSLLNPRTAHALGKRPVAANVIITAPAGIEETWQQVLVQPRKSARTSSGLCGTPEAPATLQRIRLSRDATPRPLQAYTAAPRQEGVVTVGDAIVVLKSNPSRRKIFERGPMGMSPETARALCSVVLFAFVSFALIIAATLFANRSSMASAMGADEL